MIDGASIDQPESGLSKREWRELMGVLEKLDQTIAKRNEILNSDIWQNSIFEGCYPWKGSLPIIVLGVFVLVL